MPDRADTRVAIVLPAYQAADTIADVVQRARHAAPAARLCVVDDGSTDGTAAIASRAASGVTVLTHPGNRGKGAALVTGFEWATGTGAVAFVTLDADGQHPPEEIPRLLEPLLSGSADLVLGARARTARGGKGMPWGRRLTNWMSSVCASRVGGVRVPDAQTGFRAIRRAVVDAIQVGERGYDYETAFLLAALRARWRVASVAVPTIYNGTRSHFRYWGDTWRQARVFARYGAQILGGTP